MALEQNNDEDSIYGEKEIVYWVNVSGTEEEKNEMRGLECSTVCSRDVDID